MQKTSNFSLNQWEATDPIRREDFNADNAAIDAAIKAVEQSVGAAWSANNAPWEMGTIDISYAEDGEVIKTFDFEPSAVFLFETGAIGGVLPSGGIAKLSMISDVSYYCYFELFGNTLTLRRVVNRVFTEIQYIALR